MENKNDDKDLDNLDKVYENSIFSITEDVQYPLFDAEKAKSGIVTEKESPNKKPLELEKKNSTKSRFMNQMPGFSFNVNNPLKFGDSFEAEIKIDEPLSLISKESKPDLSLNRPTSSIFSQSLGLNSIAGLPQAGRSRPIGVIRPTPQVGKKDLLPKQNVKPKEEEKELSPRSQMMPGLAAKINTISRGGSFSKYVPQVVRTSSGNNSILSNGGLDTPEIRPVKLETRPPNTPLENTELEMPPKQVKDVAATKVVKSEEKKDKAKPIPTSKEEVKATPVAKSTPKKSALPKSKASDEDTKSKQGLAGRKDVVYKTLLRSVKRYYSTEFESRTEYATLTKSKQEKR